MEDYPIVSPAHTHHESELGSGSLGAYRWRLMASIDGNGDLCLGIKWAPSGDQDEGDCGFGRLDPKALGEGQEPISFEQSGDGQNLAFAPTPPGATTVRLFAGRNRDVDKHFRHPNEIDGAHCKPEEIPRSPIAITHHLPSWYGGPRGGWFTALVPYSASLNCVVTMKFTDKHGHVVDPPYNF